jgi:predicted ABC-type ATPase
LEGGHNIDSTVVTRRYKSGIKNLFTLYCNKVDSLFIYDNSKAEAELIAEKEIGSGFKIHNQLKFKTLKSIADE